MNTTELKKIIKKELKSLKPCEKGLEEFETKDLKDISNGSKVWFASRNVRTCKIALESGLFDVNMQNKNGKTALDYVLGREDYNIVKLLLDNGANVNMQNKYGYTALMYAVDREDYNTVKLLLDNGADVNMQNKYGYTALDYAEGFYERTEIFELLNKYTNK